MKLFKKHFGKLTAVMLALCLLFALAVPAFAAEKEQSLKIAVLSDVHYLSPDLIKDTQDFTDHLNSDRKMFAQGDAILDEMIRIIEDDAPDVLLISGDLTKDGERQSHRAFAEKLTKLQSEMPKLQIYLVPGNHDINNSNAMNFNTADGVAIPAERTSQQDFRDIYGGIIDSDKTVIARFTPAEGKLGGGLSYVARPKDGFTVIGMDTTRNSADNTSSGIDEHETSGCISPELEKWVIEQITAAKKRGDTVIGVSHHGFVPHFSMEPTLMSAYLVVDFERISAEFADAGMQYVFTGHMHANDISAMTTENGNTLYDIETGSVVSYPSPMRLAELKRTADGNEIKEEMKIKTVRDIGPINYVNPVTGEEETIENISAYGREQGFSTLMLTTTANVYLNRYFEKVLDEGGIRSAAVSLINGLAGMNFSDFDQILNMLPVLCGMLLPQEEGKNIYYDRKQGGIAAKLDVNEDTQLDVLFPLAGVRATLDVLLDKLDSEVLAEPEALNRAIAALIAELTEIPVTNGGNTLLEYVNFVYQSHLGGEDSLAQPAWVVEANAKVESGTVLDDVLAVLIKHLAPLFDDVLANITFEEFFGSSSWNSKNNSFIPASEGRTPLVRPNDGKDGGIKALITSAGVNWVSENGDVYTAPVGTKNPEKGYTLYDFIYSMELLNFEMKPFLEKLVNGADGSGGLLSAETKGKLNTLLTDVSVSMGRDSNFAEDNEAVIKVTRKVTVDRSALEEAIAKAEKLDLSEYTEASAKALSDALSRAKALPADASQAEVDDAAEALNCAIDALVKVGTGGTQPISPDAGDSPVLPIIIVLAVAAVGMGGAVVLRKKKEN